MKERLEKILALEKAGWKFSQTGAVGSAQTFFAIKGTIIKKNSDWEILLNNLNC